MLGSIARIGLPLAAGTGLTAAGSHMSGDADTGNDVLGVALQTVGAVAALTGGGFAAKGVAALGNKVAAGATLGAAALGSWGTGKLIASIASGREATPTAERQAAQNDSATDARRAPVTGYDRDLAAEFTPDGMSSDAWARNIANTRQELGVERLMPAQEHAFAALTVYRPDSIDGTTAAHVLRAAGELGIDATTEEGKRAVVTLSGHLSHMDIERRLDRGTSLPGDTAPRDTLLVQRYRHVEELLAGVDHTPGQVADLMERPDAYVRHVAHSARATAGTLSVDDVDTVAMFSGALHEDDFRSSLPPDELAADVATMRAMDGRVTVEHLTDLESAVANVRVRDDDGTVLISDPLTSAEPQAVTGPEAMRFALDLDELMQAPHDLSDAVTMTRRIVSGGGFGHITPAAAARAFDELRVLSAPDARDGETGVYSRMAANSAPDMLGDDPKTAAELVAGGPLSSAGEQREPSRPVLAAAD